jgi:hypothetical protein
MTADVKHDHHVNRLHPSPSLRAGRHVGMPANPDRVAGVVVARHVFQKIWPFGLAQSGTLLLYCPGWTDVPDTTYGTANPLQSCGVVRPVMPRRPHTRYRRAATAQPKSLVRQPLITMLAAPLALGFRTVCRRLALTGVARIRQGSVEDPARRRPQTSYPAAQQAP